MNFRYRTVLGLVSVLWTLAGGHDQSATSALPPIVIGGAVPLYPNVLRGSNGEVHLRITVGAESTDVAIVSSVPAAFGGFAAADVKTWKFLDGSRGVYDLRLHYRIEQNTQSVAEGNSLVRMTLPSDVTIVAKPDLHKDLIAVEPVAEPVQVSEFAGVVHAEERGARPVPGAFLLLHRETDSAFARPLRTLRTDPNGSFSAHGLPSGRYKVEVSSPGYSSRSYTVILTTTAPRRIADFALRELPSSGASPITQITAARIPNYPQMARLANIEGTVILRVSIDKDRVLDIDADGNEPELVRAAVDNFRSWRFGENDASAFNVAYRYTLLPGDCHADQRIQLSMRFPNQIEIVARRMIPCGLQNHADQEGAFGNLAPLPPLSEFHMALADRTKLSLCVDSLALKTR